MSFASIKSANARPLLSSTVDIPADNSALPRTPSSEMINAVPGELPSRVRTARYYRPGLDILRCLAFFLVLTHHAFPVSPTGLFSLRSAIQEFGAAGVCIFFTLSAFLITELLLREVEEIGTIHIRAFYLRRVLRIWPLYLSVLILGVAFPHFYHHFPKGEPFIVPYLLMSGNWAIAFHGQTRNTLLSPLWSISVEEQFYVIWPSILLLWGKRGVIAAALIILPLAWATDYVLPALNSSTQSSLWYNSFSQFQFFALGGLVAIFMHRHPLKLGRPLRLLAIALAFACFFLAAFLCHFQNSLIFSGPGHILAGYLSVDLGCLLFLLAFLDVQIPSAGRPLIYLGKISYGLYVFHMFILGAVVHFTEKSVSVSSSLQVGLYWTVTALIVTPLAALSYEYFERPFLRFKERFSFVASRSV
jgi:peptidoglycan/LPS O-acetylase OafA/YrhL